MLRNIPVRAARAQWGCLTPWQPKQRCSSVQRLNYSNNADDSFLASAKQAPVPQARAGLEHAPSYINSGEALLSSPDTRCEDLSSRISKSYSILDSCPWLVPRPLYALAVESDWLGPDQASLYMVQARMPMHETNAEMDMLFGMATVQLSAMRDGVVAFDKLEDAEAFSLQLQDELKCQAYVATFDSHELFRIMADASGVVVHLEGTTFVPTPFQLSSYVSGGDSVY